MESNSEKTKSGGGPRGGPSSSTFGNQSHAVRRVRKKCFKLQEKFNTMSQNYNAMASEESEKTSNQMKECFPSTSTTNMRSIGPNQYVAQKTKSDYTNERVKIKEKIKNVKAKFAKMNMKFNGTIEENQIENEHVREKVRSRSNSERSSVITDRSETLEVHRSKSVTLSTTSLASESILEEPTDEQTNEESKKNRRKRRRRNAKNFKDESERVMSDVYNLDITNDFKLNAETLLIIDLLSLPEEERQDFLVRLAKLKNILVENPETNCVEVNPKISNLRSILCNGNKVWEMNQDVKKRLETFANSKLLKVAEPQKKERSRFLFEELVNLVVLDGLTEEQKSLQLQFTFPITPKKQRIKNYIHTKSFTKSLEEFAQICVEGNLGVIIEGEIRVNAKNNDQAFIKHVHGEKDAMFSSLFIRKCALHGDIVRAFIRIKPTEGNNKESPTATSNLTTVTEVLPEEDDDEPLEITPERSAKGFVIKIIEEVHNRRTVGSFLSYRLDSEYITFVPRDMKMSNIRIYREHWPETFTKENMGKIQDVLYVAEIIGWSGDICVGKILQAVGKCGELEAENSAILLQNRLTINAYDEKFNEKFYGPIIITDDEKKKRKDIRSECVFTIDPLTARDLDDAMSCKRLPNGNYEIAVHISDVTYFLEEDSELDRIVKQRTTSVYMVNEVFHMLPKPLCLKCSLLPGEDKLAFSVFWEMDSDGKILSTSFCRTILNSCVQLAYEHAQKVIDNPDKYFTDNDFPMIHNGFQASDIVEKVKVLYSISEKLRKKRFDNGALKINRPKLYFDLDPETGAPTNYGIAQLDTANYLIEEFMLLANQSVAKYTFEKFPHISILRRHEPPLPNVIKDLKERLTNYGMELDIKDSKAIYDSLLRLVKENGNSDITEIVLSHLISKPMSRAKYFCSESRDEKEFWHYALSIPIYTHFTSPIRRYPDVLVHRVLSAALDYTPPPKRTSIQLQEIAGLCNEHKVNAKNAGDDSANLYFLHYIKSKNSLLVRAAVLDMWLHAMEVILIETGHIVRIPYPKEGKNNPKIVLNNKTKPITAQMFSTNANDDKPKELKMFSEILVEVYVEKNKLRGRLAIPPISENSINSSCNSTKTAENVCVESINSSNQKNQNERKGEEHIMKKQDQQFAQLESKTFYNNKLYKEDIKTSFGMNKSSEPSVSGEQMTPTVVETTLKGLETYLMSCIKSEKSPFECKENPLQDANNLEISDTFHCIQTKKSTEEDGTKSISTKQLTTTMKDKFKQLELPPTSGVNFPKSLFDVKDKSILTSDSSEKSETAHCIRAESSNEDASRKILDNLLLTLVYDKSKEIAATSYTEKLSSENKPELVTESDKSKIIPCIRDANVNLSKLLSKDIEEASSTFNTKSQTSLLKLVENKSIMLVSDKLEKIDSEDPSEDVATSMQLITLSSDDKSKSLKDSSPIDGGIKLIQLSESVVETSTEVPLKDAAYDDYVDAQTLEESLSSPLTLDTSEEGIDWVTPPTSPFI